MKSSRDRPKVARTTSDEQEDRLSSLPDSILCHILSFLPTKYAAMTSVLSTRWKNLFLGVPNIDLDDSLVLKPQYEQVENCHFENFVNRRLMLCTTSSITKFRLKCRRLLKAHVFNLWLTALFSRNVKVLVVVEFSSSSPLCPPSGIFRSETLVVLKLCGRNIVLQMPEFVSFPNLKKLRLRYLNMHFESDNLRFAEGYPVLEELRLDCISFQKKGESKASLEIFMRTLKKLAIIRMERYFSRIDIDTPHLRHLECLFPGNNVQILKMQVNLCVCEYLVSAHLSCWSEYGDGGQWFTKLLSKVNHIKELKFTEQPQQFLNSWAHSLPQFPNLTHLMLSATEKTMWNLLQRAPNLKEFSFHLASQYSGENCLPLETVPSCFAQNLREIRMRDCLFYPREIELVRFFLGHGAILGKMIIEYPSENREWSSSTVKQLLNRMQRSPECKIQLDDHIILP